LTVSNTSSLLNIKCVFWFSLQLLFETFLNLGKTERDIIKNVHMSPCKVPVIIVRFQLNLNFLHRFSKNTQIPNFMKTLPVASCVVPCALTTDERSDRWRRS
jgi:hypothetical protein